jgi:hypothetical protein
MAKWNIKSFIRGVCWDKKEADMEQVKELASIIYIWKFPNLSRPGFI